jgi:hypothetical protein
MCNQTQTVPSITLQTAVLMQVQEFAKDNQMFSVHDITAAVRRKTANGELEIPEVEVSGASFRFDIPHVKVKAIFDELWQTGVFDPFLTLNRRFNGTYFEYTPFLNTPYSQTANITATQPSFNVVTPTTTPNVVPVLNVTPTSDDDVKSRIRTYLNNCVTRNFRPTLKQVQSAIKRTSSTGWTCDKIGEFIEQDLGYTIVADPDFVSASQVVVV